MSVQQLKNFQYSNDIDFVWLELTDDCNLNCIHCYGESGEKSSDNNLLSFSEYKTTLSNLSILGCKQVQFLGGEPTLNKHLPQLINCAKANNYTFIEIFSNLINISEKLFEHFISNEVNIATSVYSHIPEVHDEITMKKGSFNKTIGNIKRILASNIALRVSIIEMSINKNHMDDTIQFLKSIGVKHIGTDKMRPFGRASSKSTKASLKDLCGSCAGSTLCIAPNGNVSPCIMSKQWSIGSIRADSLSSLVKSKSLRKLRKNIYINTFEQRLPKSDQTNAECTPGCNPTCGPACSPCTPHCGPACSPYCSPACAPKHAKV